MANPFVSARIPQELKDKLDEFCSQSGKEKSTVLIEALAKYLDYTVPEPTKEIKYVTVEQFQELSNKIDNEISQLKDELNTLKQTDNNVISNDNKSKIHEDSCESFVVDKGNTSIDNYRDNKNFENINTPKLLDLVNLTRRQIDRLLQNEIIRFKKNGGSLSPAQKLDKPLELKHKDGILVNNQPYKLFYLGEDNRERPLWNLIPDSNGYLPPMELTLDLEETH